MEQGTKTETPQAAEEDTARNLASGTDTQDAAAGTDSSSGSSSGVTPVSGAGEEQVLYCIVNEVKPDMISVSDTGGNAYVFSTEDAQVEVNDKINITYTGNPDDMDPSAITVVKIEKVG